MKMAKEGRLTLKNMRLEAEKIVKAKRDEVKYAMANYVLEDKIWLRAGQMMEATFKNLETKLEEKEKFAERWEAEQKEKLKVQRLEQLLPLGFQFENGFDLGNMDEQMFQSLKLGLETAKKEKEEAERKAEEDRKAKEKAEAEERARIKAENERLKAEAEAKEKQHAEERAKAEAERKALEEKARKEKAAADAKLTAEREAKEKLEAELKAKAEAEEKAKREAEAKIAAELKTKQDAEKKAKAAPDKAKLNDFANMLDELALPELKSEEANKILTDAKTLLAKVSAFIREKSSII
ncbi:MAG: hypothetical protein IT276_14975 [Ignavibacteriaceae bacterium]|nr:hypothetical protein [Ignavibacteriaceae bacterium]